MGSSITNPSHKHPENIENNLQIQLWTTAFTHCYCYQFDRRCSRNVKGKFLIHRPLRHIPSQLSMFGVFWPIIDVELYCCCEQLPLARDLAPNFYCMHPFPIFSRKKAEMGLHLLTATNPVGFVTDFYRQGVTPVSGRNGWGYFSNYSFDAVHHGYRWYTIPWKHFQ